MALPDDFDPTHALDGWRAPAPAPLDLDLRSLQPARAKPAADAKKQAWVKQHGFDMTDVEDVELREPAPAPAARAEPPVVELRVEPPAPPQPPDAVIADVALPPVAPMPEAEAPPTLDLPPAAPAPDPRLLARWHPAAWQGLTRPLSGAAAEVHTGADGLQVEHRAAQWLCAAWPPRSREAGRDRWPAFAALAEGDNPAAAWTSLLSELPDEAPLWMCDDPADWGLVAEVVLAQGLAPSPSQQARLQALVDAERDAHRSRLTHGYARGGRVARVRP